MKGRLLIVDDEEMKRTALRCEAGKRGYAADDVPNAVEGLERIRRTDYDVVVTDLRMPRMDGLTFLRRIRELSPDTTVIIMTAYGTVQNAVEAMKAGAYDYLLKPFSAEELFLKLDRTMEYREARALNRVFLEDMDAHFTFHRMVGASPRMRDVYRSIARVARTDATVLVTGESGTGKELAADAIHHFSARSRGPLVKVSCATFAREVLESELFGHVKGAFTGAHRDHRGRFEAADGGTLFLDDVDDVPPDLQVKLLRVLETHEVERVGGEQPIEVDIRLVASTKVDLETLVRRGGFREDLFYRLNVVSIELPPLRERAEDVARLAQHFLRELAPAADHDIVEIDDRALGALLSYDWPGNVRELRNAMERAVTFARSGVVTLADLPEKFDQVDTHRDPVELNLTGLTAVDLAQTLHDAERRLVRWALEQAGGNQGRAARLLDVPRTTLRDRMARLGIVPGDPDAIPSAGDGNPSPDPSD